jgi:uncharacterized membrane protein YhaH (DUF805 family)
MNRKNFLKLALWMFIIFVFVMAVSYFFFHFVTDEGVTLTWHPEAGKPFVTELIGNFGVLFFFASVISLLIAFIFCDNGDKKDNA